jgi:hypothetical protein
MTFVSERELIFAACRKYGTDFAAIKQEFDLSKELIMNRLRNWGLGGYPKTCQRLIDRAEKLKASGGYSEKVVATRIPEGLHWDQIE